MRLRQLFSVGFLLFFLICASAGHVLTQPASPSASDSPLLPEQPDSGSAPIEISDPETTTLELTHSALNILTKRIQGGVRLLKASETSTSLFQRNPQAERTALEESLAAYARKLEERNWETAYESIGLDIKIFESRREMVQNKLVGLEQKQKETQESLKQTVSDLSESRKLLEDLEQRFITLNEIVKSRSTSTVVQKLQLITSLKQVRETYQGLLQEMQVLLQSNLQKIRLDLVTGSDTLNVYKELLPRFAQLLTQFDDKSAQVNSRNLEEQARAGLESTRSEQNALQVSLETLDKKLSLLSSGSSRIAINAQREALLANKDSLEESIRWFELLLRQSRLMQQFGPFLRQAGFLGVPKDQVFRSRADATTLLHDLRQEMKLVQKKKELFVANRQLLEKAVIDLEGRQSSASTPEFREELKARRQNLKYLGEAGRKCVEQENTLNVLIGELEKVQAAAIEFAIRKREEELFGRKTIIWRPAFPSLAESKVRGLPSRLVELLVSIDDELGTGLLIVGLILILLMPLAFHQLSQHLRLPEAKPILEDEVEIEKSSFLSIPGLFFSTWFQKQHLLLGVILPVAGFVFLSPSGSALFFLPLCLITARLIFSMTSHLLESATSSLPHSASAIRRLAAVFFALTPFIVWLRTLEMFPEVIFLTEFSLKILLVLPAYSLFRNREEAVVFIEGFLGDTSGSSGRFLGWLYRGFTALLMPDLLVALYGYQNLALWFFFKTLSLFGVLVLLSAGRVGVDRLSARWFGIMYDEGTPSAQASFLHILCRKSFRFLIWIIAILALISIFGLSRDFPLLSPFLNWANANGIWVSGFFLKLGLILGIVILALDFSSTIGESILAYVRQTENTPNTESERRASTLVQIFKTTTRVLVFGIAGIMVLQEIGVDIKPLLTGAGILGVAIGFGSQSLIKDFFSGFFILVENQFRVGDVIDVNGKAGLVEKINLKTTVLRSVDGSIYIIPNGEITSVKNMTFTWSRAVLEVGIGYGSDVDRALELLQKIGDELRFHQSTKGNVIERPEVLGVERFEDSSVVLRMLVKTKPLTQWEVARVFRKRILEVFRREGIEIPFPQRVLTVHADPDLTRLLQGDTGKSVTGS